MNSLTQEEREKEFILLPESASIYHTFQQDENGNVINILTGAEEGYKKYVHPIYGYEIVLDKNGEIVTNPVNAGTYNFYNPKLEGTEKNSLINGTWLHTFYDALPYYGVGNSNKDTTTGEQRILRNFYPFIKK